ncbi:MAG: tyrosine-type recombinase/integrase [Paludibacter sp.]|nr:tyrosine-type recombinase/integrase [Paludibacter sp.]
MSAKLSPFGNPLDDLTFWAKEYIGRKIVTLSSRAVDTESAKKITSLRQSIKEPQKTLDDIDSITKEIARVGMKAVRNYSVVVTDFIRYCINERHIESISDLSAALVQEDYFGSRHFKSIKTKKNYYRHIVAFIDYIENQNYINDEGAGKKFGMEQMPRSYDGEKIPETLYPEEFEKFVRFINTEYKNKNAIKTQRNRLMLKILCYSGIRSNEVLSLTRKSIGTADRDGLIPLKIVGKGNKEKISYVEAAYLEDEIIAWLKHIDEKENTRLFDLKPQSLHYVATEALILAGIKKDKTGPHLLRHSYATYLLSIGVDLARVQKLMNHKNIATTTIYAKVADADLKKAAKLFGDKVSNSE